MPRAKRPKITKNGRPQIYIDFQEVDRLLQCGCDGATTAALIGVSYDTLMQRTYKEKGMGFSEYKKKKEKKVWDYCEKPSMKKHTSKRIPRC